ncbi:hypothetical protein I6A60_13530 [Frankia sp. AgB1.9]|uniref:hypothetical protein n=1 Tax=unclassified Frankia TaxID=2632575 RepID=UPI0019346DD4|nr:MULTISPECIES: hypothetical protein [unclassified Frankia]MBL7494151.1 hypothetical protein [Frankia sp. AgW1.1]MBL7548892.1 hypothetical protein [Frankia sp. AgB1.9]MBL7625197.1 hypothetical protein [Frankia sp. AgB1.8]
MGAIVTRHGHLNQSQPATPYALVALDLLRSYLHDSLHYGAFREYVIHNARIFRARYGINRREPGGSPYSPLDRPDAESTRNLGIITEGATDREARIVARHTAKALGLREPSDGSERVMFRDTIGRLSDADRDFLAGLPSPDDFRRADIERYIAAMAAYHRQVSARYATFLGEIGGIESEELHVLIVAATVSGNAAELNRWLDLRHGTGAFERLFRRPK